ncbi:MAG: MaoC family dehydratase [Deltaproteobacteria bacterium]|nr:MaoC family dehydratase [Deltaproteobacteria bacterium]
MTSYFAGRDELVGRQRFRIFKFAPGRPAAEAGGAGKERSAAASASPAAAAPTAPGAVLPSFALPVTTTRIVAGAIATRDFMPVHHDRDYARKQGAPDVFMNILTTNGYVARYVTDWAGSEARLRRIQIRLGGPATPGTTLRFDGRVASERIEDRERVLEVALQAVNELGLHASGTVELTLPTA